MKESLVLSIPEASEFEQVNEDAVSYSILAQLREINITLGHVTVNFWWTGSRVAIHLGT
jgi:hypothetical protein